jgi:hypothetical protein
MHRLDPARRGYRSSPGLGDGYGFVQAAVPTADVAVAVAPEMVVTPEVVVTPEAPVEAEAPVAAAEVVAAAEAAVVAEAAVTAEAAVVAPGRGGDVMQADHLGHRCCRGSVGGGGGTEQHRAGHRGCAHSAGC